MSVTLTTIWTADAEQLQVVLQTQGRNVSANLGRDRAIVALIYYNAGNLTGPEAKWVAHPDFVTVMSAASTLEAGLVILMRPLVNKILALSLSLEIAWEAGTMDNIGDVYRDEDEGADEDAMTAGWNAVGNVIDAPLKALLEISVEDYYTYFFSQFLKDLREEVHEQTAATLDALDEDAKTPEILGYVAAQAAWKAMIGLESKMAAGVSTLPMTLKPFDPITGVAPLLQLDLVAMVSNGRCYYLLTLWEMLGLIPAVPEREKLLEQLQALVVKYDCQDILPRHPH